MNFDIKKDIFKNNYLFLIIGSTLSLLHLDKIGLIFMSIFMIKNFLSSQNKPKWIIETIAMIIIFVSLLIILANYELSLYR